MVSLKNAVERSPVGNQEIGVQPPRLNQAHQAAAMDGVHAARFENKIFWLSL